MLEISQGNVFLQDFQPSCMNSRDSDKHLNFGMLVQTLEPPITMNFLICMSLSDFVNPIFSEGMGFNHSTPTKICGGCVTKFHSTLKNQGSLLIQCIILPRKCHQFTSFIQLCNMLVRASLKILELQTVV